MFVGIKLRLEMVEEVLLVLWMESISSLYSHCRIAKPFHYHQRGFTSKAHATFVV